jgi:hypothetical protein
LYGLQLLYGLAGRFAAAGRCDALEYMQRMQGRPSKNVLRLVWGERVDVARQERWRPLVDGWVCERTKRDGNTAVG